jgi:hypothetical protein
VVHVLVSKLRPYIYTRFAFAPSEVGQKRPTPWVLDFDPEMKTGANTSFDFKQEDIKPDRQQLKVQGPFLGEIEDMIAANFTGMALDISFAFDTFSFPDPLFVGLGNLMSFLCQIDSFVRFYLTRKRDSYGQNLSGRP